MPDMNIRNVDKSLLREVNIAAAKADLTLRDFVIQALTRAVNWEPELEKVLKETDWSHDPKTCRVYGCLMCAQLKV